MNLQSKKEEESAEMGILPGAGGWTELCGQGSHCQESLGNTPRGEFQAWLGHQGELGWGRRKKLWCSRKIPHLSMGKSKSLNGCPVSSRMFLRMKPRGCCKHKIWTCCEWRPGKYGARVLRPDKGRPSEALWSPQGSHITITPSGPHQWPGCLQGQNKDGILFEL